MEVEEEDVSGGALLFIIPFATNEKRFQSKKKKKKKKYNKSIPLDKGAIKFNPFVDGSS
jgi:hypothetical protein